LITLDTSGLIAYMATRSRFHQSVREVIEPDPGPLYIAVGALAEVTFMIERDFPPGVEDAFLSDLSVGAYSPYWDDRDLIRVRELMQRYHDLPLGFADAAIAACAERHGGRVVTLDRRHFDVVAQGEGTLTVLPT
jgi:predicted nucleic acid-binding protein